jgi:ribonuclease VapC
VIIDTSVLVAILDQEPEAERIVRTLASAPERTLSAANLIAAGIVMQARRGDDGARDLDLLLAKLRVEIAAVTASSSRYRAQAFRRYRAAELNLAGAELDRHSGLPERYAQKLVGPNPIRRLGAISLGPFLGTLAVRGVLVEDKAAVERLRNQTTTQSAVCAAGYARWQRAWFTDAQVHAANSEERRGELAQVFAETIGYRARQEGSEGALLAGVRKQMNYHG